MPQDQAKDLALVDRGRRRSVRRRAAEACRPIPREATEPGRLRDPRTRRHLPDARLHRAADPRGLHLAAERGAALRRLSVHLGLRELRRRVLVLEDVHRSGSAVLGPRDRAHDPARLSHGLLDRVLRRQVEVDALLPDPGAVLRVVRDPHRAVELHPRRRRRALRLPEEPGAPARRLPGARGAGRRRGGHHVQLPAVHRAAALRRARPHRQAARRGGEGPVRDEVRGVPQGRAAPVVPRAVRGPRADVRAGDRRLRELQRARVQPHDDGRSGDPDEVPDGGRLPRGGRALGDPDDRHARDRARVREGAGHRGLDAGGGAA